MSSHNGMAMRPGTIGARPRADPRAAMVLLQSSHRTPLCRDPRLAMALLRATHRTLLYIHIHMKSVQRWTMLAVLLQTPLLVTQTAFHVALDLLQGMRGMARRLLQSIL